MSSGAYSAIAFIIKTLAQLYLLLLLLRLWLPVLRADFRNPIAQGILKLTSPLVVPARRVLPSVGRIDTATILIAVIIQYLTIVVILMLGRYGLAFVPILITSVIDLAMLSLNLFTFAIFIRIILSWVAPHTYNDATALVTTLAEPVLRPFRRVIPPLGGIDISPIFAIILLQAALIFIRSLKPIPV